MWLDHLGGARCELGMRSSMSLISKRSKELVQSAQIGWSRFRILSTRPFHFPTACQLQESLPERHWRKLWLSLQTFPTTGLGTWTCWLLGNGHPSVLYTWWRVEGMKQHWRGWRNGPRREFPMNWRDACISQSGVRLLHTLREVPCSPVCCFHPLWLGFRSCTHRCLHGFRTIRTPMI